MFTSKEYEEESGPILYNATIILDNRPNFVYSKFLFSKLSLFFSFPPKPGVNHLLSRIQAKLYKIQSKMSKILLKLARIEESGSQNVQELIRLSRNNPSCLDPFLDTSRRSIPAHLTSRIIISKTNYLPNFALFQS